MPDERRHDPQQKPTRLAAFARFFKGYMSVATVVAAAIPIPITNWKMIPIYTQQRGFLTVYASLFCFLLLAFVFSIRHRLAPSMFFRINMSRDVIAALPAVFIALTLACVIAYHAVLQDSLGQLRENGLKIPSSELLEKVDETEIPNGVVLAACYLGIFIFAELAFVLMAMREYLQDELKLDEKKLLRGETQGIDAAPESEAAAAPESTRASG